MSAVPRNPVPPVTNNRLPANASAIRDLMSKTSVETYARMIGLSIWLARCVAGPTMSDPFVRPTKPGMPNRCPACLPDGRQLLPDGRRP